MKKPLCVLPLLGAFLLVGCGQSSHQDLIDFMEEAKRRPKGQIEPLPTFSPYQPFAYSAMTLRSPFEKPIPVDETAAKGGRTVVPDLTREKEFLERFNVTALKMVGTVEKAGKLWALIDNGERDVVPVTIGNYLGLNHGKIITTSPSQIEIMEIVGDGSNGWVERPRIIKLEEKE
ncbi:type IV pilus biogenesis protein PilP [Cellvibrio sp. BR]|jgi:type IV pilus assembly protein PilP|uniref:pilus assembly protein PilP n=1 Tax=unclassified Cellvibrio TaxID=2624793 RepID=UPI0002600938|nr:MULTISPECIES: pilus assembly protein PilP [unclassified Cellvibrio]EIK43493.1 type IV pilus biogenesis protein PilP [Cellvibrio sp. BR]QEY11951.1 pilus assembly protein PilP [Cellvibrio sp. KY-YJ-3]UUA72146.1 pilus assembly protein PilP [Cellvibrio sp. QJXJ]